MEQIILLLFMLCGYIVAYAFVPNVVDINTLAILLIGMGVSLLIFFSKPETNKNLKNQKIRASYIFVIGFLIVNFQAYIDLIFEKVSINDIDLWVDITIINESAIISSVGLLSFLLGYSVKRIIPFPERNFKIYCYPTKFLKLLSLFFLVLYFYFVNPAYLKGGYALFDMGASAKYLALAFNASIFAIYVQESRNIINNKIKIKNFYDFIKHVGLLSFLLVTIYLISVLLSGDRGPIITYSMLIFGSYLFINKPKYSSLTIIIYSVSIALVLTLLGFARKMITEDSLVEKLKLGVNAFNDNASSSIFPMTKELSGSVNTVHYVVSYIHKNHDYFYGMFQIRQLIDAIPFSGTIFGRLGLINYNNTKYNGIAEFITWIAQGDNSTYGNGASIVADFYLGFGILGVFLGMLFFGYFMRVVDEKMYGKSSISTVWLTIALVYFSNAIYISRSFVLEGTKAIVMILFLLLLNNLLLGKIYRFKR
ncbi:hypothetical protein P255_01952 [Acinetobacter brisouii CIP 110357]|uniref:Oligosaccharide repeat unit polymerase n=1 Tax=Acinetobacter brisouii CIP 110357 TaxID=1341683 RepID=V2UN85_9GAMM|nr:O-antigen polymerase [Acinetobacter brisouii]ENV47589.1 hypothetical protein F954_00643 [Acinetobacter brisouii ANC 4119]ESK51437.1 hypothetical protein P255_01952 [Acinetobacter brisouii CIP 110357]